MKTWMSLAVAVSMMIAVPSLLLEDSVDHGIGGRSVNPISWIKMGMILDIGDPGDPDSVNAAGGFVMFDDGIYKMWYNGLDGTYIKIMYATSSDGLTWTKHGVVVDLGDPGDFDDEYVKDASVQTIIPHLVDTIVKHR